MKIPEELKEAISNLTPKDKDKLIFRLLKKDLMLANQLLFELVSSDSVEDKRAEVKKRLANLVELATTKFYSTGYLHMDMREMSGIITEQTKITKDKFGEAQLNLWMCVQILESNKEHILSEKYGKAIKFCIAIIARTFKIMLLVNKLHEDYLVEFEDDLKRLGELIGDNPYLMKTAIHHGLDVNWLLRAEIPQDIEQKQKELRAMGFLK